MKFKASVIAAVLVAGGLCPTSSIAAQDDRIAHEAVLNASLDEAWAAFTTAAGLEAWMVPHADIELKVGGTMRTNFSPKGKLGDPGTIHNTILSFEPKRMLSFKVSHTPAGFPFVNAVKSMWTVVYFDALGPNRTRVRQVNLGFGNDEESRKMREFFETSDAEVMSALQKRFAAQHPQ